MGTVIGTILVFIFVFGILVFIHEFGHFIMAKMVGIKVEVFSWGYGKRLFGVKKGDTDYRVSIVPMGGFVKFSGEEAIGMERPLQNYDFLAKKRWQRFLVILLGPVMNIVLAVILFAIINMVGVSVPEYSNPRYWSNFLVYTGSPSIARRPRQSLSRWPDGFPREPRSPSADHRDRPRLIKL